MNTPIYEKSEIKTERLVLAPLSERDIEPMMDLFTDPVLTKTFMVPELGPREAYRPLAEKMLEFSRIEDRGHLLYGIYEGGRLIGFINDCGIEDDSLEIGYALATAEHGKGYATEAVRAVLEDLRTMGFKTVTAGYFEENPASCRVMMKCGMHPIDKVETGEYRGETHKCLYCAIDFDN